MDDSIHYRTAANPTLEKMEAALGAICEAIAWTDAEGRVEWFNAAFQRLIAQDQAQILGASLIDLLPLTCQDRPLLPSAHPIYQALHHHNNGSNLYEFHQGDQARLLEISWSYVPNREQETAAVLVIRDVTDRHRLEKQLLHNVFHDSLTGLPNRTLFRERLIHTTKLAKHRPNARFAVLFLDLDRFKVVNDSLGHMVGDQLIALMAERIESCLRPGDTVARLGGDEFAILLEDIQTENDAVQMAQTLLDTLSQPCVLNSCEVSTSLSIGIALNTVEYEQPDDLLRNADIAMYRAKTLGRSRYEVFESGMHQKAVTLLQMENDLRRAIERQEFVIYYQPIVALNSKQLNGFEALLRWQHPELGLIAPADFIPVAEDTGLIVPLGYWVLREACRQMQQWVTQFQDQIGDRSFTMSVNLSARQFTQTNLLEQVDTILRETQLLARHLKLEITESVIMSNAEAAAVMLGNLQARGIQISIDDFGTGYSSLSYLYRLPIDTLKIDRSFISSVDVDGEKLELVRTIVALAWNIGMDIVAEGVETPKQLAQLRALRCESGQGYLFAKPLDQAAAEQMMFEVL